MREPEERVGELRLLEPPGQPATNNPVSNVHSHVNRSRLFILVSSFAVRCADCVSSSRLPAGIIAAGKARHTHFPTSATPEAWRLFHPPDAACLAARRPLQSSIEEPMRCLRDRWPALWIPFLDAWR